MNKIFLLIVVCVWLVGCLSSSKLEIVPTKKQVNDSRYISITVTPSDDLIKMGLKNNALIFVNSNFCDGKTAAIPADNDLYLYESDEKVNDFIVLNRNKNILEYENKYDIRIAIEGEYHANTEFDNYDMGVSPRDICIRLIVTRKLGSLESNQIILKKEEIIELLSKSKGSV